MHLVTIHMCPNLFQSNCFCLTGKWKWNAGQEVFLQLGSGWFDSKAYILGQYNENYCRIIWKELSTKNYFFHAEKAENIISSFAHLNGSYCFFFAKQMSNFFLKSLKAIIFSMFNYFSVVYFHNEFPKVYNTGTKCKFMMINGVFLWSFFPQQQKKKLVEREKLCPFKRKIEFLHFHTNIFLYSSQIERDKWVSDGDS